jgi:large subunit ribosomal protein L9
MKLLLNQDVKNLGMIGDIVEVKEGYARNYLLPQRIGVLPTNANMKQIAAAKARAAELRKLREEEMKAVAKRLGGLEITIRAAVNEEGTLYGSVGPREIAAALRQEGHTVEPDQILLHNPIRQLDNVLVPVRFTDDLVAEIKVWVVRETAGKEDDPAAAGGHGMDEEPDDDADGDADDDED